MRDWVLFCWDLPEAIAEPLRAGVLPLAEALEYWDLWLLHSGGVPDPTTVPDHMAAMAEWLGLREMEGVGVH